MLAITRDNLGSHQVGGFVESFKSNFYYCRFCYINNFDNVDENKVILRSPKQHDFDVEHALISGMKPGKQFYYFEKLYLLLFLSKFQCFKLHS